MEEEILIIGLKRNNNRYFYIFYPVISFDISYPLSFLSILSNKIWKKWKRKICKICINGICHTS